ncbi:Serine/threonine-protein kinase PknB [Rubripirellula obstinata]|uniref:non-specific serine/threonine protein kinase n=1 Tax=Rubripirellula obstinata TaxID=406547 RepID=A0A5B1CIE4_9BACT|nr:WD40 repeat domain-containing serine/threonine protein kinase [Rubripirellula obstinata]KAA1260346.1 Serine/threonine-protein kinase PknB [Rubripirellula obstinata]
MKQTTSNEKRDLQIAEFLERAEGVPKVEQIRLANEVFPQDSDARSLVLDVLNTHSGNQSLIEVWDVVRSKSGSSKVVDKTTVASFSTDKDTTRIRTGSLPTIPGHRLGKVIGRGGMGIVVEAFDEGLQIDVAIKLIRDKLMETDSARLRFLNEARAVAKLRHTNIVGVVREGETADGTLWFSMERIIGTPLNEIIAGGVLPIKQAVSIARGISAGLAFAHEKNILHRDIKPSNIIVDREGLAKVVDFGLAKDIQANHQYTLEGSAVGTPAYMSPEQISKEFGEVSAATDVYAIGGVLYAMLTGGPPFEFDEDLKLLDAVVKKPPEPVNAIRRSVPKDLNSICLKCLEKNPSQRYQSAEALVADLDRFASGIPVTAHPIGPATRSYRWAKRNPIAVAVLGALSILLFAAAYFWNQSNQNAEIAGARAATLQEQKQEINNKAAALVEANELMQQQLYGADVRDAASYLEDGRFKVAFEKTMELIPEPGEKDRRGIEWRMLWNRIVGPYRMHYACGSWFGDPFQHFSLSHDNQTLVFADTDVAFFWDYSIGELKRTVRDIRTPRYLADGKTIAFARSGELWLGDAETLEPRLKVKIGGNVNEIISDHDGKHFVVLFEDDENFHHFEVRSSEDGSLLYSGAKSEARHRKAKFSPDGNLLAIACNDRFVRVIDLKTEEVKELKNGYIPIGLDFSPNGKYLIACPLGYVAKIWRTDSWEIESELKGNDKAWRMARFTPSGDKLILAGFDGRIWEYRVSDWRLLGKHSAGLTVWWGDISPSGNHLVLGGATGKRNSQEGYSSGGGNGIRVFHLDRDFEQGLRWEDWGTNLAMGSPDDWTPAHSTEHLGNKIASVAGDSKSLLLFDTNLGESNDPRTFDFKDIVVEQLQTFGSGRYSAVVPTHGGLGYVDWTDQSLHWIDEVQRVLLLYRDNQSPQELWIVADQGLAKFTPGQSSGLLWFDLPFAPTVLRRFNGITYLAGGSQLAVLDESMKLKWQLQLSEGNITQMEVIDPLHVVYSIGGDEVFKQSVDPLRKPNPDPQPWMVLPGVPSVMRVFNDGKRMIVQCRPNIIEVIDTQTRRTLLEAPTNVLDDIQVSPWSDWLTCSGYHIKQFRAKTDADVLESLRQMAEADPGSQWLVSMATDRLVALIEADD